ncbi:Hint domain containing protein [Naviculisporaceae sp. PSN 640]
MVLVKTHEKGFQIPHRPLSAKHETATLELHPVPGNGLIVKVEPPREPSVPTEHVPCDIVLVIDVSGSMIADAPVPTKPGEKAENNGLNVLDLVKHAARTIVETFNENDRLAIITFASSSTILQRLVPMTEERKKQTEEVIESMQPKDATNLWHAIRDGIDLFVHDRYHENPKRIPALMVLTDGCPNHMCPTQGYVPKLKSNGKLPIIINTFGFGYSLRSGLLKSIAEVGGGSYAFIPDAGMVGTVFVHAVANLQSTFARNAVLRLTYPSNLTEPSPQADQEPAIKLSPSHPLGKNYTLLTINLHNLQYGQTRDIFLEYSSWKSSPITASLTYQRLDQPPETLPQAILYPSAPPPSPTYSPAETAYHISRSRLVSFLLGLSPPSDFDEERTPTLPLPEDISDQLTSFITSLPCNSPDDAEISSHPLNKSLMRDLTGQISLAITNPEHYSRWGVHYLLSLADAHSKQICNSFKDPGPLMYGTNSPLFQKCRDRLDAAFDNLPPPKPSNLTWAVRQALKKKSRPPTILAIRYTEGKGAVVQQTDKSSRTRTRSSSVETTTTTTTDTSGVATPASSTPATQAENGANYWADVDWSNIRMSSYNSADNPCFAGCVRVLLAESEEENGNGKMPLTPVEKERQRMDYDDEQFPWLDDEDNNSNNGGQSGHGHTIKISKLRAGMQVHTPRGPRRVVAVLKTAVKKQDMCLVGKKGLLVTPWHPVSLPQGSWTFPRDISRRKVRYTGSIYSVLLERDVDPAAHAVLVGDVWGVTLGHGLVTCTPSVSQAVDVRAHPFFGDYAAVVRSLEGLHRNSNGLVLGGGVKRDVRTGLVDGFRRLSGEELRMVVDEMMSGKNSGSKARVQRSSTSSHAGGANAVRHGSGSSSSRAETCMWRRTVGCV